MKKIKWTKEALIELYKSECGKSGKQLTKKEWIENVQTPSDMPIRCIFGNWNSFMKECGYEPNKPYLSELARENSKLAHKGKRGTAWKGGKYKNRLGYIEIWNPNHPNSKGAGYILEHRLVMSEFLQRPLENNENVHHKNGVRDDNRIENLELWVKAQPAGQREEDIINFCIEFLTQRNYIIQNPELLKQ